MLTKWFCVLSGQTVVMCAHRVVMLVFLDRESGFPVVFSCKLSHTVVVGAHTVVSSIYTVVVRGHIVVMCVCFVYFCSW